MRVPGPLELQGLKEMKAWVADKVYREWGLTSKGQVGDHTQTPKDEVGCPSQADTQEPDRNVSTQNRDDPHYLRTCMCLPHPDMSCRKRR